MSKQFLIPVELLSLEIMMRPPRTAYRGQQTPPSNYPRRRPAGREPIAARIRNSCSNVDLLFAQAHGGAGQFTRTVRQPHNGDVRLLKIHAQAAKHRFGGADRPPGNGRGSRAPPRRIERPGYSRHVRPARGNISPGARLIWNRYRELFRFRHVACSVSIQAAAKTQDKQGFYALTGLLIRPHLGNEPLTFPSTFATGLTAAEASD